MEAQPKPLTAEDAGGAEDAGKANAGIKFSHRKTSPCLCFSAPPAVRFWFCLRFCHAVFWGGDSGNRKSAANVFGFLGSSYTLACPGASKGTGAHHDSQIEIGRIPVVCAEDRSEDRQAEELRNVFDAGEGDEARESGTAF